MSKYVEAFEKVKEACASFDTVDELITLKELVDKATPKKPVVDRVYDEVWDCTLTVATCSNCACEVCNGTNYCDNCGQALDWGEEDETR